ncbi:bifunctional hydroxymethylpyrimidine kinase/phosphomethylpyrimidine kinase [Planococcus sp. CP5-4]|uniref:bifunctional hydroxymethylpyrimidine kinase/phosphomethylpyrimidine kinase n=1 Tax=unclassified Planococcus (in: firmicutes) TaxID=2662419 RepID=UPI001C212A7E|nr:MULTISPECIES: bifunctional hydroxymethylpyrimidine kinase/phosphomethylpyrimidine kinase [unclassified Planococcus (in: firmicutes)]MBU9673408.1 bifunctional hydroxymethylpyrimidine kinase/phosphomethylpyrimidine kinase [Planococcus sp. CP5-4_YE]MBV0908181.1 bifunctional hydroxymethylpyrimidine kinase/phosphomethylpyrimidine kinase [Planococcus sp. CP5-4_UN]MBW6062242.1 bifunctional hydroxymethylpyrimidine kinase/phosphomethylpyrimidine kinase [Planococcus sp. CP5-4]
MDAKAQVLTIAGSDSGGGAGIQADLKTFQELGTFGCSAVTAVTAQNTQGVHGIYPMDRQAVKQQLDAIGTDFNIRALKTGMLFDAGIIEETALGIKRYNWEQLVIDPVMIAKGGASLLQQEAVEAIKVMLVPLAKIITPNIPEAEVLSGIDITDDASRRMAAEAILSLGAKAVVIKGGHSSDPDVAEDFYMDQQTVILLRSERLKTHHTHGTGCTFSAALTAELGKGKPVEEALFTAKEFIQAALAYPLNIGHGHGPTHHAAYKESIEKEVVHFVRESSDLFSNGYDKRRY